MNDSKRRHLALEELEDGLCIGVRNIAAFVYQGIVALSGPGLNYAQTLAAEGAVRSVAGFCLFDNRLRIF